MTKMSNNDLLARLDELKAKRNPLPVKPLQERVIPLLDNASYEELCVIHQTITSAVDRDEFMDCEVAELVLFIEQLIADEATILEDTQREEYLLRRSKNGLDTNLFEEGE